MFFYGLCSFPNKPWFSRVCKSFENTVGKGEIARNEQFLLFPQCFLSLWRTFCHFRHTKNCRLQSLSVWKSLKFVVWERVKEEVLCIQRKYRAIPVRLTWIESFCYFISLFQVHGPYQSSFGQLFDKNYLYVATCLVSFLSEIH